MKIVFAAKPQKFSLYYKNKRGVTKFYKEITPIEIKQNSIVSYVFGGVGIRSFKNEGIQSIEPCFDN